MSVLVDEAAEMAKELVSREIRGPGDLSPAMHRLASRLGVSFNVIWSLRYRKPKTIVADAYFRIDCAYRAERERQQRLFEHDMQIAEKAGGSHRLLVRAAASLAGQSSD